MALGRKTGGRKIGSKNKKNKLLASAIQQAAMVGDAETPLEHMLRVMRNTAASDELRLMAAKSAAPFVHRQLKSVEQTGEGSNVRVEIGWIMPGSPALPPPDKT